MMDRTTETEITFSHPFRLRVRSNPQPPGTYRVVTDEEEVGAYRSRPSAVNATTLHIPAIGLSRGSSETILVNPVELAAAPEKDKQA